VSDPDDTLSVYSDYVCPFCYIGRASLREYLAESDAPPAVEWRFFDLRGYKRGPDGELRDDVDDGKDDDYFAEVRENVARLSERYGLDMDLSEARGVDSWDAQQAALYVRQSHPEQFRAFHDATFDALWEDGRDIEDPDVIAEIADGVEVPADEVRAALDDETLSAELEDRFEAARDAGVTGIPTFVYDDYAARGAVPPEQLRRLVEGR
jgi:predicted DsbA family dithiol-disulfide isomerase